jgi:hypothetical protein
MAQALVASNKNGRVQINFGTLFRREIRDMQDYGAVNLE